METATKKTEIARLYYEVSKVLNDSMRKSYEGTGITVPQSLVIGTLLKYGEMKITELSRRINLSNSTISGIVDRLERQRLVERSRSDKDRRVVLVKLAPGFEEICKGTCKKAEESFNDLLNPATPAELETIINGLNVLKKVLNQ